MDEEYDNEPVQPQEEQHEEAQPAAPAAATVPIDIFGDEDSELSELEDEPEQDDRASRSPSAAARSDSEPARRSATPQSRSPSAQQPSDDEGDGDDYQDAGAALKKVKIKRKPRNQGEDGEAPKKKKKKTKSKEVEEEEEEVVDPETARRRALNARLEAIIKKPKKAGGKKKRGQNDDDIDLMNDEVIAKLREKMLHEADKDIEENEAGKYAVHKLRMLPEVVEMMQKSALAESLVESGILEAVKRWLEPLPDKSLPALNIQRPLFEILRNLSIETSALKSSGLGKIVYFYTKCKRVEPVVARMANQLVSDWMRPIIRRSKAFSDKELGTSTAHYTSESIAKQRAKQARESNIARKLEAESKQGSAGGAVARRHARIPNSLTTSFKVAPAADPRERPERAGGASIGQGNPASGTKMKGFTRKLAAAQSSARRV